MRKIILRSFQSPGDIVVLAAAVRDLHASDLGVFATDVRTSSPAVCEGNPLLTPLREDDPDVTIVNCARRPHDQARAGRDSAPVHTRSSDEGVVVVEQRDAVGAALDELRVLGTLACGWSCDPRWSAALVATESLPYPSRVVSGSGIPMPRWRLHVGGFALPRTVSARVGRCSHTERGPDR